MYPKLGLGISMPETRNQKGFGLKAVTPDSRAPLKVSTPEIMYPKSEFRYPKFDTWNPLDFGYEIKVNHDGHY